MSCKAPSWTLNPEAALESTPGAKAGLGVGRECLGLIIFEKPRSSFVSVVIITGLAFLNGSCDLIAFSSYLALTALEQKH